MDICNYRPLSFREIVSTLDNKRTCKLGTADSTNIEIVPMWYVFDCECKKITFYLISFESGTKINNIRSTGLACVFVENCISNFYRDAYQTIVANGTAEIVTNDADKRYILNKFRMKYHTCFKNMCCSDVDYIRIPITSITGREYNYDI